MGIALLFWERVSERLSGWMVVCECILRMHNCDIDVNCKCLKV